MDEKINEIKVHLSYPTRIINNLFLALYQVMSQKLLSNLFFYVPGEDLHLFSWTAQL